MNGAPFLLVWGRAHMTVFFRKLVHLVCWHRNLSETQRGSKQAQPELGIQFEDGKGVDRDLAWHGRADYSGEFRAGAGWVDWGEEL
ncbi:hypothetical protein [Sphingorhabdus sp. M41]|uniref:hypothetical protein n=1 Tax=Sphingorhabdus sp. M41 TaxID=1806885 RepID=UPI0018D4CC9A|nr:hypothetical protein [Sphingorhabdus sp. M41]